MMMTQWWWWWGLQRGWLGREGCPLVGTAAPPTQRAARPYRLHTGCTGCTLLGPPECLLYEPGSTFIYYVALAGSNVNTMLCQSDCFNLSSNAEQFIAHVGVIEKNCKLARAFFFSKKDGSFCGKWGKEGLRMGTEAHQVINPSLNSLSPTSSTQNSRPLARDWRKGTFNPKRNFPK